MKIFSGIMGIFWGLVFLSISLLSFDRYFGGNEEKVKTLERLNNSRSEAIANIDSTYKETSLAGASVYTFDYTFKVRGKSYEGFVVVNSPYEVIGKEIRVRYLRENPSINSTTPEKDLENAKKASKSKMSLIIGIVMAFLGLGSIGNGLSILRNKSTE